MWVSFQLQQEKNKTLKLCRAWEQRERLRGRQKGWNLPSRRLPAAHNPLYSPVSLHEGPVRCFVASCRSDCRPESSCNDDGSFFLPSELGGSVHSSWWSRNMMKWTHGGNKIAFWWAGPLQQRYMAARCSGEVSRGHLLISWCPLFVFFKSYNTQKSSWDRGSVVSEH